MPRSLDVSVTAYYKSPSSGQPITSHHTLPSPLQLCCEVIAPKKSSNYKLTFETNKDTPPPIEDFASTDEPKSQQLIFNNIVTFQYNNGNDVYISIRKFV